MYKIFVNILYQRLLPYTESEVGECQCGFRVGLSTSYQLFNIKQILEKIIVKYQLLVKFKAAYDSVKRKNDGIIWNSTEIDFSYQDDADDTKRQSTNQEQVIGSFQN